MTGKVGSHWDHVIYFIEKSGVDFMPVRLFFIDSFA